MYFSKSQRFLILQMNFYEYNSYEFLPLIDVATLLRLFYQPNSYSSYVAKLTKDLARYLLPALKPANKIFLVSILGV